MTLPVHLDILCKLLFPFYIIEEELSSFTRLLFSIERFIVVSFPLRAKTLLTFHHTWITTVAVLVIITLCSSHLFISVHSINFKLSTYCAVDEKLSGPVLSALYWFWLGVVCYLLPNLVTITLNMFILRHILSANSKRQFLSAASGKDLTAVSADSSILNRERRVTISLVVVSIATSIIYAPEIIMCGYHSLTFLSINATPQFLDASNLMEFSWIFIHMVNIAKVTN